MNYLRERFTYDHEEGCLRWQELNDNYVYIRPDGTVENNVSTMSRVKPGTVAGKMGIGEYRIKRRGQSNDKSCGLRMIWQHVTGELIMGRIRTMNPRDMKFSIDNLYVVPNGQLRVHKDRAKNRVVVSYCFERKQYTTVAVNHDYNKQILSYHNNMNDAIEASNKPEVSFL